MSQTITSPTKPCEKGGGGERIEKRKMRSLCALGRSTGCMCMRCACGYMAVAPPHRSVAYTVPATKVHKLGNVHVEGPAQKRKNAEHETHSKTNEVEKFPAHIKPHLVPARCCSRCRFSRRAD